MDAAAGRRVGGLSEGQLAQLLLASSDAKYPNSASGFVLADLSLKPICTNDAAFRILNYSSTRPRKRVWEAFAQNQLRLILQATHYSAAARPLVPFMSGRRHYICRSFLLDVRENQRAPLVALLMERQIPLSAGVSEALQRYHLSPREHETVMHLTHGLSTKEIAARMSVSPNTIKQFVRLIMSKMSVTTRSGILGKLLIG